MQTLVFLISALFSAVFTLGVSQSMTPPQNLPSALQEPPSISQSTTPAASAAVTIPITTVAAQTPVQIAQCLTAKGAKFYGAYWCSHCADQKEQFGEEAMQYITYVECDKRGENAQPQECEKAQVQAFPTWTFPGKQSATGTRSPQELAKIAGCL